MITFAPAEGPACIRGTRAHDIARHGKMHACLPENSASFSLRMAALCARNGDKGVKPTPGSTTTPQGPGRNRGGSVTFARRRPWTNAFSTEAPCTRLLERRRDSICVEKLPLAAAGLRPVVGADPMISSKHDLSGFGRFASTALSRSPRINRRMTVARSRPRRLAPPSNAGRTRR